MFSNLPHSLLACRLKQTSRSPHFTSPWSYLAAAPSKGGPNINLEIFRNIDGILDWNVDCPEGKRIIIKTRRPRVKPYFRWGIKALSCLLYFDRNVVEDSWLRLVYLFNQCKVWKFVWNILGLLNNTLTGKIVCGNFFRYFLVNISFQPGMNVFLKSIYEINDVLLKSLTWGRSSFS